MRAHCADVSLDQQYFCAFACAEHAQDKPHHNRNKGRASPFVTMMLEEIPSFCSKLRSCDLSVPDNPESTPTAPLDGPTGPDVNADDDPEAAEGVGRGLNSESEPAAPSNVDRACWVLRTSAFSRSCRDRVVRASSEHKHITLMTPTCHNRCSVCSFLVKPPPQWLRETSLIAC